MADISSAEMMVIACPACNSRYRVRRTDIRADGRRVRCSHCRHSWQYTPQQVPTASEEKAPAPPSEDPGISYWSIFWWGYAVVAAVLVLIATFVFRDRIAESTPLLARPLEFYGEWVARALQAFRATGD